MIEQEKEHGFLDLLKDGLSYISKLISSSLSAPITDITQQVMESIDYKMIQIEKRVVSKISSQLIIYFGGLLLTFALFFVLIDSLGLSNAASFFIIGITILIIGLLLKVEEYQG